jgi:hypothetical protein
MTKPSENHDASSPDMPPGPTVITASPDVLLTRQQASAALRAAGFPVAHKTLATKACRGGGPPFRHFGKKPLYRWADLLSWAQAKLSAPMANTSQADVAPFRHD